MENNTTTFEGIRLRHLASLSPRIAKTLSAFYLQQESAAVAREDYEQAALWRDAAGGKLEEAEVSQLDYETWIIKSH